VILMMMSVASKLDEERAVKSKAEAKRDADLVKQVGEATSAQVESMIKTQITSQVMPSLTELVSTAVNQHLGAAIATSLDKAGPLSISSAFEALTDYPQLYRPCQRSSSDYSPVPTSRTTSHAPSQPPSPRSSSNNSSPSSTPQSTRS
jgi:hypothetical protein